MPSKKTRQIIKIIKEIAQIEKIKFQTFSSDWIIELQKDQTKKYIHGYHFEINSTTSSMLANDKAASSILLTNAHIPNIEHKLFFNPNLGDYINPNGNWEEINKYFKKHKKIVAKPNNGTGGTNVFLISKKYELEKAINYLFTKERMICLSPFKKIKNEYRVIILNNEPLLIYKKNIPKLIGNGRDSVLKILEKNFSQEEIIKVIKNFEHQKEPLNKILKKDEILNLNWKHNLGQGAQAEIIKNKKIKNKLIKLAQNAARAINIRFASIDIVEVGNEFLILEINSGVMLENFSKNSLENYKITKEIYKKAILEMFQI